MGDEISYLKRFLLKIEGFRIEKAVYFGSRLRGDNLKKSDLDLILVSGDFEGIFFTDRVAKVYRFWEGPYPLELFCYTPLEFERKRKEIGMVRTAIKEGIEIELE
jgi:hypothetical protein